MILRWLCCSADVRLLVDVFKLLIDVDSCCCCCCCCDVACVVDVVIVVVKPFDFVDFICSCALLLEDASVVVAAAAVV